jgi:hypothetical protein
MAASDPLLLPLFPWRDVCVQVWVDRPLTPNTPDAR